MAVTRMLASMAVADLDAAVHWYTALLGRAPDALPMEGLAEWHLDERFGLQVFQNESDAGHSSVVLDDTDLDDRLALLAEAGIENDGISPASESRLLQVVDLDGNSVVFTGR